MAKYKIKADLDWVTGYIEKAHFELEVEKEEWDNMTEDEQEDRLMIDGHLVVTDCDLASHGGITEINKEEI